jgi:hypothetical protein
MIGYLSVSPLRAYLRSSLSVCSGVDRPAPEIDLERAVKAACLSGISESLAPLRAFRASPKDSGKRDRSLDPWASVRSPMDCKRDLLFYQKNLLVYVNALSRMYSYNLMAVGGPDGGTGSGKCFASKPWSPASVSKRLRVSPLSYSRTRQRAMSDLRGAAGAGSEMTTSLKSAVSSPA